MREIKFRAWDKEEKLMKYGFWSEDEYIYMQYIGMKDKNGKEIYEGDIVKYTDGFSDWSFTEVIKSEVVSNCGCCYHVFGWRVPHSMTDHLEVIGNIYKNPELLEKEVK